MHYRHILVYAGLLMATLLLVSCGGANSGDVFPMAATTVAPTSGPDSFLIFPNPQKQPDGTLQTNTTAYATAYYAAIDPTNSRDTLDKWKAANGFGDPTTGTETTVVFGDVRDLGYGRRMTARKNNDGTIAVMVENYLVSAATNYGYSSFNLDAAVVRDQRWHVGTNAIEFSASTCVAQVDPASCVPTIKFAKFFTFDPTTGKRLLAANLDGRGNKAMPSICITCHGGRGDPLTPAAGSYTGQPLFPWVANSASQKRGDVQAHLQPLIVDSFGYSATPGYTRADQEARLKAINELVLSSYPISAATTFPEDANRRIANGNEWNGTAASIIKAAYGGDTLPNSTFSDSYVPANWSSMGQAALYKNVVAPYCRTCHIQRGSNAFGMDDLDFDHYCSQTTPGTCDSAPANPYNSYFYGYASRIKAHVLDRGNMPLAKIVYQRFWGSNDPGTLATFLQTAGQTAFDSSGAVLKPGRLVADPGPDRTTTSPVALSAANSLYATTYSWSVVSGVAALSNPTSATPTLTATTDGLNVLQLVVGNGTVQSAPVQVKVTIDSTMGSMTNPMPATPHFSDIKAVLKGPAGCTGCHYTGGAPPIIYADSLNNDIDRNGDGIVDPTDDKWFYTELRGRINFTDVAASPLLLKPSGHHHGGGYPLDPSLTSSTYNCQPAPTWPSCQPYATLGQYNAAAYNMFVNWILNGAPY